SASDLDAARPQVRQRVDVRAEAGSSAGQAAPAPAAPAPQAPVAPAAQPAAPTSDLTKPEDAR
ncbi:hypothetical protein ACFWZJ_28890, partial [Streptomyces massasporeus]